MSQIIQIDEAKVSNHLNGLVRETVQETLNKMLDAEAQEMCNAQRYERTEARKDCRAGFYQRKLQTQAGEVELNVPKLRHAKFETAIIERYRRRESSIEVAAMLKAIHTQEDAASAQEKATAVVEKLKALTLKKAAEKVAESVAETQRCPSQEDTQKSERPLTLPCPIPGAIRSDLVAF